MTTEEEITAKRVKQGYDIPSELTKHWEDMFRDQMREQFMKEYVKKWMEELAKPAPVPPYPPPAPSGLPSSNSSIPPSNLRGSSKILYDKFKEAMQPKGKATIVFEPADAGATKIVKKPVKEEEPARKVIRNCPCPSCRGVGDEE